MRDLIDFGGTTPPMEGCAQVGSRDYDYGERARAEARVLIHLIRRQFGPEPDNASLRLKSHPHDFGTYYTVVCEYDVADRVAAEYAQRCDASLPQEWDEVARRELDELLSKQERRTS